MKTHISAYRDLRVIQKIKQIQKEKGLRSYNDTENYIINGYLWGAKL